MQALGNHYTFTRTRIPEITRMRVPISHCHFLKPIERFGLGQKFGYNFPRIARGTGFTFVASPSRALDLRKLFRDPPQNVCGHFLRPSTSQVVVAPGTENVRRYRAHKRGHSERSETSQKPDKGERTATVRSSALLTTWPSRT